MLPKRAIKLSGTDERSIQYEDQEKVGLCQRYVVVHTEQGHLAMIIGGVGIILSSNIMNYDLIQLSA